MSQKLLSLICCLSSAAFLLALAAHHRSAPRSEPLITAEKFAPSASPKPILKVEAAEMVTYHLELTSAGKRWSEIDPKPSAVYSSPPTQHVRLGWIDSAGVFHATPACTSFGGPAPSPSAEIGEFECDLTLPKGESAVFMAQGIYTDAATTLPIMRFIPVNEPIVAGKPLSGKLTVKVDDQFQPLKSILHLSRTPLEAKQTSDWNVADQWIPTTPFPQRVRDALRPVPPPSPSAP